MTRCSHDEALRLLREALPPPGETSPATDLWPTVLRRVHAGSPAPTPADWILMTVVGALCLLQPSAALVFLIYF